MDMKDFIPLAWLEMFVISGAFLWEWVESGFLGRFPWFKSNLM